MAFWRQVSTALVCAFLLGILGGCTPASNSPFDEEKDPYVVQGRNREAAYDHSGAIESYHRALEANPRSSVAHYRLGLLYESEDRDPAAAIHHFQQFLKLRPSSEHATVIRQRILGCKQELAKEVSLGLVSGEMKNQLDELVLKNQRLSEECQRLGNENERLKEQLLRLQSELGIASRTPSVPSTSYAPPDRSPTTPSSRGGTIHTVQKGDTYYSIARRYGVSMASLEAANPGVNPKRLSIGQQLSVPSR